VRVNRADGSECPFLVIVQAMTSGGAVGSGLNLSGVRRRVVDAAACSFWSSVLDSRQNRMRGIP
jgi:hypothetical protein